MASSLLGSGRDRRIISGINVTPLVDVMLVLLIIFMVTATYIVRRSLEVKLPEASTGQPSKVTLLALTIDASGRIALDGTPISEQGIRRFIRTQKQRRSQLEAVIAADKAVPYGTVVRVIDLVRAEGVVKFAINVLKPAGTTAEPKR